MNKENFKEKPTVEDVVETLKELIDSDYETFIQALLSIELNIHDKEELTFLYDTYWNHDTETLLNQSFFESVSKDYRNI